MAYRKFLVLALKIVVSICVHVSIGAVEIFSDPHTLKCESGTMSKLKINPKKCLRLLPSWIRILHTDPDPGDSS